MIALRGVRFSYGRNLALMCDTLDIGPGVTLLLGPNGAGKSTLLKLVAGVEHPAAGTVTVDGHDMWQDEIAARAALAYVPEHPDLTPYATVGEVLGLVCRLRGRPVADGEQALETVGLDGLGDRSVRELSMGQRRRAVLAAAFIGEPSNLLLDEPLEAMDRAMRSWLTSWIAAAAERGATVLVATHDVEPFVPLAKRAVVVAAGTPRSIDSLPDDATERMALLDRLAR
ncbi:MAG TPA: ABC transporter ATP-binding protein [Gemmatimonadaceae bacterium]|nr:ABC transporter ATP-binding protein [Gemmatimonadaceae bacterium]